MSKFDDLFNDFMKDGSNKKNDNGADMMANLFKKLSNLKNLDMNLGEPDSFENYEENGVFFQKQIWNTKHGKVIKTVISDVPFKGKSKKTETKKPKLPLEVQLENAVKEENYEAAAKLRDRIAKRDAKKACK